MFRSGYEIAKNNVTIENEQNIINQIDITYNNFYSLFNNPIIISGNEKKINWYFTESHKNFSSVKNNVNELMSLNDRTMFNTASELQNKANRSVMPGIVSIAAYTGLVLLINAVFLIISAAISLLYQDTAFRPLLFSALLIGLIGFFPLIYGPPHN